MGYVGLAKLPRGWHWEKVINEATNLTIAYILPNGEIEYWTPKAD